MTSKNAEVSRKSGASAAARKSVPVFSLYGEESVQRAADFVHIEDIRTRSERYGWQIGSHRHHGLLQIVFVRRGHLNVQFDSRAVGLKGPCLITVPPSTVHEFRFSPETDGKVLTIARTLFSGRRDRAEHFTTALFSAPCAVTLARADPNVARIRALLCEIEAEFRERAVGAADMLEWLVAALLLLVARLQAADRALGAAGSMQADLFQRFRALVEAHYLEHRPVTFYAGRLGVGLGRLNRACRAAANRSAFDVVQERLLLEARRKLTYIAAPVSLLAHELGFEDPAYFWRFFRRRTGLTPNEFRGRGGARPAAS
jgi:AraC family transcriptional activator of pobA